MSECVISSVLFDHERTSRIGMPEAVFGEGKPLAVLEELFRNFADERENPILFTRIKTDIFEGLPMDLRRKYQYHPLSRTAFVNPMPGNKVGRAAVVSAGTADGATTWEAAKTLEFLGVEHMVFEDNGVSGLWRLTSKLDTINSFDVLIVVAGLDAALASVMGGLSSKPIIAVPTSVGYGMSQNGQAALNSMLVSCAQGLTVVNIDNGFGAACAAARILNLFNIHQNSEEKAEKR